MGKMFCFASLEADVCFEGCKWEREDVRGFGGTMWLTSGLDPHEGEEVHQVIKSLGEVLGWIVNITSFRLPYQGDLVY